MTHKLKILMTMRWVVVAIVDVVHRRGAWIGAIDQPIKPVRNPQPSRNPQPVEGLVPLQLQQRRLPQRNHQQRVQRIGVGQAVLPTVEKKVQGLENKNMKTRKQQERQREKLTRQEWFE